MRISQAEKMEIIRIVEGSQLSARRTLRELGVGRSTFYGWYQHYLESGYDGLAPAKSAPQRFWNRIPDDVRERVVEIALERAELSPRERGPLLLIPGGTLLCRPAGTILDCPLHHYLLIFYSIKTNGCDSQFSE